MCYILTFKTYDKWQNSPVIVSFDEKMTPNWKIPFPAVTICPETKSNTEVFNITESLRKLKNANFDFDVLTIDEARNFEALSQVSLGYLPNLLTSHNVTTKLEGLDVTSILKKIALPLDEMFAGCSFRSQDVPCEEVFFKTFTEIGLCYTFNVLDFHDIFRDDV